MYRTFLDPKTCGFGKMGAIHAGRQSKLLKKDGNESNAKFGARLMQYRYSIFQEMFHSPVDNESFKLPLSEFNKKHTALHMHVIKWSKCGRKSLEMKEYFDKFSAQNWANLSNAKRREHTLFECKGCHQSYSKVQSLFPVRSPLLKKRSKDNPFTVANDSSKSAASQVLQAPNKTVIRQTVKELYNKIDPAFQTICGVSFGEALAGVTETNLQIRESKNEKKTARRDILRKK